MLLRHFISDCVSLFGLRSELPCYEEEMCFFIIEFGSPCEFLTYNNNALQGHIITGSCMALLGKIMDLLTKRARWENI